MNEPKPPASHLESLALGQFSKLTLERGQRCAEEGQVVANRVEREAGGVHVQATVHDGRGKEFAVDAWLGMRGRVMTGVEGVCDCPVEEHCKHLVALLITIESRGLESLLPRSPADAVGAQSLPPPQVATRGWLDELAGRHAVAASDADTADALLYLLRPGDPATLALVRARSSRRGAATKLLPYRPQPYDLVVGAASRHGLAEADIAPLRLYLALQAGGTYFLRDAVELTGETGALLLRLALATGRLRLDERPEQTLVAGAVLDGVWQWRRDEQGLQRLCLDLPSSLSVIHTLPPFYVDLAAMSIGMLETGVPPATLEPLLRSPALDEGDVMLVRESLPRLPGLAAFPLPEPGETVPAGRPVPRLLLTRGLFHHRGGGRLRESLALAVPWFDYPDGISVQATGDVPGLLRRRVGERWQTLQRDRSAEDAAWDLLHAAGLDSWRRLHGAQLVAEDAGEGLMPRRDDVVGWLDFISNGVPVLERAGMRVEFAEDFPYAVAQAEDWVVRVEESVGSDWFDLDLGVRIGGEVVSLVEPVLRLLREHPDLSVLIRGLEDGDSFPLVLDERRVLPVPAARLKAWLLPLLEFFEDERPRLARHHAAALAGLEGLPAQWIGGEALLDLGRRLRDFSGIERCLPAPGFTASLRPYQQDGLDWLQFLREFGLAGILADDMGLGKTVQTLAHLHLEKVAGRADRPSLVVATTSLMANWRDEAAQFAPDLKVVTLHGKDRAERFGEIAAADLVLTTYPLLVRDRDALLQREWHLLVMDEAQFIKNPRAQSHQVARLVRARHRLSLTGTPLENHLGELWAQFDYLMPGFLGSARRFTQVYRTPIEKLGDEDMRSRLAERVRPFLLRRTKEQVLDDLPPRTEMVRWVELDGGQRDLYESLRVSFDRKLRHALAEQGLGRSQIMIFDALLKLRQICCDPRLVRLPAAEALVRKGHAHSAKLKVLFEMLDGLLDEGRRVLLFSQFTSMLGLIEAELDKRGQPYAKLTGQTRDRETPIRDFQDGRVPLFLISLKAGGTGLNLTAADTVIHYDPWWNPAVEEQATARAHRIGQDKPVFVYKLMTRGTVEERILALQDRKRGLADQLMGGGSRLLTANDLDVLFQPIE
jgi:superfamily II DNA or RNA helicase